MGLSGSETGGPVPSAAAGADPASFAALGRWAGLLSSLLAGRSLSGAEAAVVMAEILEERASEAQIAAFLVAMRMKGETTEEIGGLVTAMLAHAVPLVIEGDLLDVVGTGGDRLGSINVSTLAALIAAGAGARVCKHGGRAASSSVGTADVLEALGVAVDIGPEGVHSCVEQASMGFCLAPRFHPAMRHAAPVRRQLAVPTIFNFLGPLTNPALAAYRLVGVCEPPMAEKVARVLGAGGCRRAYVAWADDGLDELSVTTDSTVLEVEGDGRGAYEVRHQRIDAGDLGFARRDMSELRGGDATFNATAIRRVLDGVAGAHRDIGVLNAAAALVVAGRAASLPEGAELAAAAVDDGRAAAVLESLVRVSQAAAETERSGAPPPAPRGGRAPA